MKNIKDKVFEKYGVDLDYENIFKLYKIENPDLSDSELQNSIESTRKRWLLSINGANEKNAERDAIRLKNADQYETILKDSILRKKIFQYYSEKNNSNKTSDGKDVDQVAVEFAREYFKLVETTKKIKKSDVEFFFSYYQNLRKNKKSIIDMLEKDFKIVVSKKGMEDEDQKTNQDGKKKDESSPFIANLFQKATILKLKKCIDLYENLKESTVICQRYPSVRESMYDFLELKKIDTIENFSELILVKTKEVYSIRQEKGTDYVPLIDFFNILKELSNYQDVVDNFCKFKLLIKYPTLSPYMFAFVEMKPATLKGLLNIANRDYVFRDETDFILTYYNLIYDNFGILSSGIKQIIKKAEKKTKKNKVLNEIEEKLGRKKKRKLSLAAEIIYFLAYWPIFVVYFVFEVFKAIFTELHRFVIPIFIAIFLVENFLFPKLLNAENFLIFKNIFSKEKWYAYLNQYLSVPLDNFFDAFMLTVMLFVLLLIYYIVIPLFVSVFIKEFSDNLNKRYDWVGYERTFQNIFQQLRSKTENQYINQKKIFLKQKSIKGLINSVCFIVFILMIHFLTIVFEPLDVNYLMEEDKIFESATGDNESDEEVIMVIYNGTSNIRSGPSADFNIIKSVPEGTEFIATGNTEINSNGKTWYEVYLNDENTETGWASQSVIEFKE